MAELVDALASGASEHYARGGSSPLIRTNKNNIGAVHVIFIDMNRAWFSTIQSQFKKLGLYDVEGRDGNAARESTVGIFSGK